MGGEKEETVPLQLQRKLFKSDFQKTFPSMWDFSIFSHRDPFIQNSKCFLLFLDTKDYIQGLLSTDGCGRCLSLLYSLHFFASSICSCHPSLRPWLLFFLPFMEANTPNALSVVKLSLGYFFTCLCECI